LKYPIKNIILDKIRDSRNINDVELVNSLEKDGVQISESDLNKVLLDLEILGLIKVSWVTKDKRRIELVTTN
jgi:DNA-binding PadR family transcriptional regulator